MPPCSHTLPLCMHVGVHCHPSPAPFRTPALVCPPFCTLPFMRSSPTWVAPCLTCMPFACTWGHHGDGAGCTIPHSMCPLPLRVTLPLARIPPILLRPWHAHKGEGRTGRAEWGA